MIEELAELLGGAVGCSRAVTSAGWRPHSDQVGQTGTKIAPEIYIACGISGATQHMAGCKGAKKLLAINPDAEASIFASADYARDRRPARGRAGDLGRDQEGEGDIASIPAAVALAAAIAISGTLFARRVAMLVGLVRGAQPVSRYRRARPRRARNEVTIVLGQRKLLQRFGPGLMHAFIFWGFLVLLPTILIAMIAIVDKHATLPWLGHQGWYAFLVDLFAVLVLVGVAAALWIRKVAAAAAVRGQPPRRGRPDPRADRDDRADAAAVARRRGSRSGSTSGRRRASPVSNLLSHLFGDDGATKVLERVFVWAHVLTILVFLAYLPHSKHLHIATRGGQRVVRAHRRRAAGSSRCGSTTTTCPRTRSASARAPPRT